MDALKLFRNECKEQSLSLECALATVVIQLFRTDEALRTKPFEVWLGQLQTTRKELRNLKHALRKEYPALLERLEARSTVSENDGRA